MAKMVFVLADKAKTVFREIQLAAEFNGERTLGELADEPESETVTDSERLKEFIDPTDPRELVSLTIFKGGGIAKHFRGWRFFPPPGEVKPCGE